MYSLLGRARVFKMNDINTDYIIAGRHKFKTLDMDELAKYIMEDIRPNFYNEIKKGDFIVAYKNFGCGSSREQAPLAIKHANISAVIAKSFARIFFRNAINTGLPVIICDDVDKISEDDELEVDMTNGVIINKSKNIELKSKSIPKFMQKILKVGGLAPYLKKYDDFIQ